MSKKRGRPKKIGKPSAIGGTRKVIRLGGSLVVGLPPDFIEAHHIQEGDDLPYAANHLIKFIPMPEDEYERQKPN